MNFNAQMNIPGCAATQPVHWRLAHIGVSMTVALSCLLTSAPLRAQATFTPLGQFGGVQSQATDISADGSVIVGSSVSVPGASVSVFRITPQGTTVRATGLTTATNPTEPSVSSDGSTVVGSFQSSGSDEAFRWIGDGPFERLGDLPGGAFQSAAFGVSGDGSVVVGMSESAPLPAAFRWTAGSGMLSLGGDERSAQDVTPELAVEVKSEFDRWSEINEKIAEYLKAGVLIVCVVDPDTDSVQVHSPDKPMRVVQRDEELTLPEVLPDFRVTVREFFE